MYSMLATAPESIQQRRNGVQFDSPKRPTSKRMLPPNSHTHSHSQSSPSHPTHPTHPTGTGGKSGQMVQKLQTEQSRKSSRRAVGPMPTSEMPFGEETSTKEATFATTEAEGALEAGEGKEAETAGKAGEAAGEAKPSSSSLAEAASEARSTCETLSTNDATAANAVAAVVEPSSSAELSMPKIVSEAPTAMESETSRGTEPTPKDKNDTTNSSDTLDLVANPVAKGADLYGTLADTGLTHSLNHVVADSANSPDSGNSAEATALNKTHSIRNETDQNEEDYIPKLGGKSNMPNMSNMSTLPTLSTTPIPMLDSAFSSDSSDASAVSRVSQTESHPEPGDQYNEPPASELQEQQDERECYERPIHSEAHSQGEIPTQRSNSPVNSPMITTVPTALTASTCAASCAASPSPSPRHPPFVHTHSLLDDCSDEEDDKDEKDEMDEKDDLGDIGDIGDLGFVSLESHIDYDGHDGRRGQVEFTSPSRTSRKSRNHHGSPHTSHQHSTNQYKLHPHNQHNKQHTPNKHNKQNKHNKPRANDLANRNIHQCMLKTRHRRWTCQSSLAGGHAQSCRVLDLEHRVHYLPLVRTGNGNGNGVHHGGLQKGRHMRNVSGQSIDTYWMDQLEHDSSSWLEGSSASIVSGVSGVSASSELNVHNMNNMNHMQNMPIVAQLSVSGAAIRAAALASGLWRTVRLVRLPGGLFGWHWILWEAQQRQLERQQRQGQGQGQQRHYTHHSQYSQHGRHRHQHSQTSYNNLGYNEPWDLEDTLQWYKVEPNHHNEGGCDEDRDVWSLLRMLGETFPMLDQVDFGGDMARTSTDGKGDTTDSAQSADDARREAWKKVIRSRILKYLPNLIAIDSVDVAKEELDSHTPKAHGKLASHSNHGGRSSIQHPEGGLANPDSFEELDLDDGYEDAPDADLYHDGHGRAVPQDEAEEAQLDGQVQDEEGHLKNKDTINPTISSTSSACVDCESVEVTMCGWSHLVQTRAEDAKNSLFQTHGSQGNGGDENDGAGGESSQENMPKDVSNGISNLSNASNVNPAETDGLDGMDTMDDMDAFPIESQDSIGFPENISPPVENSMAFSTSLTEDLPEHADNSETHTNHATSNQPSENDIVYLPSSSASASSSSLFSSKSWSSHGSGSGSGSATNKHHGKHRHKKPPTCPNSSSRRHSKLMDKKSFRRSSGGSGGSGSNGGKSLTRASNWKRRVLGLIPTVSIMDDGEDSDEEGDDQNDDHCHVEEDCPHDIL